MTSPEFDRIDRLYREILGRPVDPSGQATYSRLIASGELTYEGLERVLMTSEEFLMRGDPPLDTAAFTVVDAVGVHEHLPATPVSLQAFSGGVVAVTIASKRHLANARVTASSFRDHHPDVPFLLLLADEPDDSIVAASEPFDCIPLEALDIPALHEFTFRYSEMEVSYAALPFLFDRLLAAGVQRVVFLKQETLVMGNLDDLICQLGDVSFFVTPHLSGPPGGPEPFAAELEILRAGVFNGGIVGVANTDEARRFVQWWMERTYSNCHREVEHGLHFEQRWLDFVPAFVAGVLIVRDPGVNVGHWNILDRDVRSGPAGFTAQGVPLRLIRFSGFEPGRPEHLTRYKDLTGHDLGDAASILRSYGAQLRAAGDAAAKESAYAWGAFDNGVPIPDGARRLYRDLDVGDRARIGNPRLASDQPGSFYALWCRTEATA